MLRYRLIQAAIASIALFLLAPLSYGGFVFALGQYKYKETVTVDGKEEIITQSVAYWREGDFWRPIWIVVAVLLAVAVMVFVSSQRSRMIPGVIVGSLAMLVACFYGQKLRPKGEFEVFFHGLVTIGMILLAIGVLFGVVVCGELIAKRRPNQG